MSVFSSLRAHRAPAHLFRAFPRLLVLLLLAVELGVVGMIYFLVLWGSLIRMTIRHIREDIVPILSCGMLASAFAMFFDLFLFGRARLCVVWWIYLFATMAMALLPRRRPGMITAPKVSAKRGAIYPWVRRRLAHLPAEADLISVKDSK